MTSGAPFSVQKDKTQILAVVVSIASLAVSSFIAMFSIFLQGQSLEESSDAAWRQSCFAYVDFVLQQQAQGLADTQIDRTTDLLTTLRGQKESLTRVCGTASEIRLARERNTPLPGLSEHD
jgi:hypothetical protein